MTPINALENNTSLQPVEEAIAAETLPAPTPQPDGEHPIDNVTRYEPTGVQRWISESPELFKAYTLPNVTDITCGGHFLAVLYKDGRKAKLKVIDIRTGKETVLKKRMKYNEKDRLKIVEGQLLQFDHGDSIYLYDLKEGKQILKFDASDFYLDLIPLSKYYYAQRNRISRTLQIFDFEKTKLKEIDLTDIETPVWGCQNLAALNKGDYIEVHAIANRLPKQYLACAQEMEKHLKVPAANIEKLTWLPVERKSSHFAVKVDYKHQGERRASVLVYNKDFRFVKHHTFAPKSPLFHLTPAGGTLLVQDGEEYRKIDMESGEQIEKGFLDITLKRPSIEVSVPEHLGRKVTPKPDYFSQEVPITACNGATALLRRETGVLKINLKIGDIVHEKEIQLQPILDEHLKGAPLATQGVKLHLHGTRLLISTVDVQERARQIFILDVTAPEDRVDEIVKKNNCLCCF